MVTRGSAVRPSVETTSLSFRSALRFSGAKPNLFSTPFRRSFHLACHFIGFVLDRSRLGKVSFLLFHYVLPRFLVYTWPSFRFFNLSFRKPFCYSFVSCFVSFEFGFTFLIHSFVLTVVTSYGAVHNGHWVTGLCLSSSSSLGIVRVSVRHSLNLVVSEVKDFVVVEP